MSIHAAACTARSTRSNRSIGWVPFALVALVAVPAIAGSLRLVELAGGPHLLPANPRLTASPVPLVVHIVSALAYAVLGAFQFSAALGRGRSGWHRAAGRVLVVLGAGRVISLAFAEYVTRRSARRLAIISRPTINSRSIRATAKVGSS